MRSTKKKIALALTAIIATTSTSGLFATDIEAAKKVLPLIMEMMNTVDPLSDDDSDGLTFEQEMDIGTDPRISDSDGDGLNDGNEVSILTNPLSGDSDNDGMGDKFEVTYGFNPKNAGDGQSDADDDGIFNVDEQKNNTNPKIADSVVGDRDMDGRPDISDNCPDWPNSPSETCLPGDINADGIVSATDLDSLNLALSNTSAKLFSLDIKALERCDVNGDLVCTADDATIISGHLASPTTNLLPSDGPTLRKLWDKTLSRVGYGMDEWTYKHLSMLQKYSSNPTNPYSAINAYITEQLNSKNIDDSIYTQKISYLTYGIGINAPLGLSMSETKTQFNSLNNRPHLALTDAKILKALYSRKQLNVVLEDFWYNHLSVNFHKSNIRWTELNYEKTLSDHMYGSYVDLLTASAKHPAMLEYLDQAFSTKDSPNENYAREVMELHTLGTDESYDHEDITAAAKILTGYRFNDQTFAFAYASDKHDTSRKIITLETVDTGLPGATGNSQIWYFGPKQNSTDPAPTMCNNQAAAGVIGYEQNVFFCLIAKHKLTAKTLAEKLALRFLGDTATVTPGVISSLTNQAQNEWATSNANLPKLYTTLFTYNNYFQKSLYIEDNKFRRPFSTSISVAKKLGQGTEGTSFLKNDSTFDSPTNYYEISNKGNFNGIGYYLTQGGEEPYRAGPPTGFSESSEDWNSVNNQAKLFLKDSLISNLIKNMRESSKFNTFKSLQTGLSLNTSIDSMITSVAYQIADGGKISAADRSIINQYVATIGNTDTNNNGLNDKIDGAIKSILSLPYHTSN